MTTNFIIIFILFIILIILNSLLLSHKYYGGTSWLTKPPSLGIKSSYNATFGKVIPSMGIHDKYTEVKGQANAFTSAASDHYNTQSKSSFTDHFSAFKGALSAGTSAAKQHITPISTEVLHDISPDISSSISPDISSSIIPINTT